MKKIILIVLIFTFCIINIKAQDCRFGWASYLNKNANSTGYGHESRKPVIDATFRILFSGVSYCTGTLINRNTDEESVGYYFVTARHCFYSGDYGNGDNVFDSNTDYYLVFNYQSPTGNNDDTPKSNRGYSLDQSKSLLNDSAFEYIHKTKLRLVDKFFWGDFALFEILTPIPPHFNITYSGWSPARQYSFDLGPWYPTALVCVHHPRGDIKKISGANSMWWLETPISTGCYTVTTIIDFLFGWIWGHKVSTKVICNYVDINPWISIPSFVYGTTEHGSSGSGLFTQNNYLIGVHSGPGNSYGKLRANYFNASIKNVMNPRNWWEVDTWGLGSRKISIYNNLTLPGGNYPAAYYFPANHYQAENKIVLRARDKITTNKPITILKGADYEFVAGNSIELKEGFSVNEGANFTARVSSNPAQFAPAQNSDTEQNALQQSIINKLESIKLPPVKKRADNNVYSNVNEVQIKCYPNPAEDFVFVDYQNITEKVLLYILDSAGQVVYSDTMTEQTHKINVSYFSSGIYLVKIVEKDGTLVKKFVKN